MKRALLLFSIALVLIAPLGCASKRGTGTLIGSGAGAVIGGVIGDQTGNTAVGAIIGAAIGGAAGAYIGNYMDKQADEIRADLDGATVERVGEGIKITFDSGILFAVNQSALQPEARSNLNKLAEVLQKYEDTDILIEGHTDSDGSDDHNLELSRNRAQSVANYLASLSVSSARFTQMGYGEGQPVADNATAEGKALNRRVELAIMANDKLKKVAEDETS